MKNCEIKKPVFMILIIIKIIHNVLNSNYVNKIGYL